MTDRQTFDGRLADALRAYAAEAPADIDALDLAHAIAVGHPRRPWGLFRSPGARLVLVLVGAALVLASIIALAAVGTRRTHLVIDPSHPLPAGLYGEWQAEVPAAGLGVPGGSYTLDLHAPSFIRLSDGTTLDWAGGVAAVDSADPLHPAVVVRSQGACGEGRYLLRRAEAPVEPGQPSADPASEAGSPDAPAPVDRWDNLRFTNPADACSDRVAILTGAVWTRTPSSGAILGPFTPGQTYGSGSFTELFQFVMPVVDGQGDNAGLPEQFQFAHRYVSDGGLRFGGVWWSMRLIDDLPVQADLCDATSPVDPDIPPTPEAVYDWLHAMPGLTLSTPVEVPVDGRTALQFDIDGERCEMARLPAGGFYGYASRAYAIPTGDDTILLVGGSDGVNYEAVKAAMEAFVRSMDFRPGVEPAGNGST